MILIVGGAYQGKRDYALKTLGCPPDKLVGPVEALVREWLKDGKDPLAEMPRMAAAWADAVVLLTEVGSGVVPMDADDRAWREAVGRCGAYLAARASRVVRVFCGIGTVIKDA